MARTAQQILTSLQSRIEIEQARLELADLKLGRQLTRARSDGLRYALSTFGAADKGRTNRDWRAPKRSADQAILGDVGTMNARARAAYRDQWAAHSGVGAYRRNVVGIGITPRSNARDPETGEPFKEFNQTIDFLWSRWARMKRFCDLERRRTFRGIQQHIVTEWVQVGEAMLRQVYVPRRDMVGLSLQLFEPEQLDVSKTKCADTGNEIRGGVEIDEFGAPVALWIYTSGHPWEGAKAKSERVPLEMPQSFRRATVPPLQLAIHFFRPDRVRQTRGYTQMSASLLQMRHLAQYIIYQLVAARGEAAWGGFLKTGGDPADADKILSLPNAPGQTGTDATGAKEMNLEPGTFGVLPPGVEPVFHTPNRPGGQFDPFVTSQVGQVAAGMELDFATIARDYSKGSFSSQRQGMLENDKVFDPLQLDVIDDTGRPVREAFKTFAILEGRAEAPGFFDDPVLQAAYLEDNWQGPAKHWIEPVKQGRAAQIELEWGMNTLQRILNQRNLTVEEVLRDNELAQQLAGEMGLEIRHLRTAAAPGQSSAAPPAPGLSSLMAATGAGALGH